MPNTYQQGDAGYKHASENFATKLLRYFPSKAKAQLLYDPMGAEAEYQRQKNLGIIKECVDNTFVGAGAPSLATVPNGGVAGNFYQRTDTPGTANQRLYICTVGTGNGTLGTWVALIV
jgi:hypothetical protein